MKQFEVLIPRSVRLIEWETLIVNAEDEEEAINNAISYENIIKSSFDTSDYETIDRYDDEIECREIKETT